MWIKSDEVRNKGPWVFMQRSCAIELQIFLNSYWNPKAEAFMLPRTPHELAPSHGLSEAIYCFCLTRALSQINDIPSNKVLFEGTGGWIVVLFLEMGTAFVDSPGRAQRASKMSRILKALYILESKLKCIVEQQYHCNL